MGGVRELFDTRRPGNDSMMGFDSLHLGPSGRHFLLHPHTHLDRAGRVMRTVHPDAPAPDSVTRTCLSRLNLKLGQTSWNAGVR